MVPGEAAGGWGLGVQPRSSYARFCRSVSASAILLCCLSILNFFYVTLYYQLLILLFYLSDLRFPMPFSSTWLPSCLAARHHTLLHLPRLFLTPISTHLGIPIICYTQLLILCNFIDHEITYW